MGRPIEASMKAFRTWPLCWHDCASSFCQAACCGCFCCLHASCPVNSCEGVLATWHLHGCFSHPSDIRLLIMTCEHNARNSSVCAANTMPTLAGPCLVKGHGPESDALLEPALTSITSCRLVNEATNSRRRHDAEKQASYGRVHHCARGSAR